MLIGVGEHAFLWEGNGPMVDLNTLIPPGASLELTYAIAINDRGEIAGFGVSPGVPPEDYETQGHAYVLLPCDEGHPNLEGCDYSMADDAHSVRPRVHGVPTRTTPASSRRLENRGTMRP
jgi:hypothetical protein